MIILRSPLLAYALIALILQFAEIQIFSTVDSQM